MGPHPRLRAEVERLYANTPLPVQRIAAVLAKGGGWLVSADAVARRAGFPHRDALYEALRRPKQLPSLTEMAALIRALDWSLWIEDGVDLNELAARAEREPAQFRHHVRRWFGRPWSQFVRLGPRWVAEQIGEQIGSA